MGSKQYLPPLGPEHCVLSLHKHASAFFAVAAGDLDVGFESVSFVFAAAADIFAEALQTFLDALIVPSLQIKCPFSQCATPPFFPEHGVLVANVLPAVTSKNIVSSTVRMVQCPLNNVYVVRTIERMVKVYSRCILFLKFRRRCVESLLAYAVAFLINGCSHDNVYNSLLLVAFFRASNFLQ